MNRKNGFTLVELLAVIVLLGLIMAIAVPNALKLGGTVKESSYATKLDLIEEAAKSYGQANIGNVKRGLSLNGSKRYTCKFDYDEDDNVTQVTMRETTEDEGATLPDDTFFCISMSVSDLVANNSLDYDEKDTCADKCSAEEKPYYDNVVINPKDNSVINLCNVYIYYKYKRVYTYFDRTECDKVSAYGKFETAHAYPARRV